MTSAKKEKTIASCRRCAVSTAIKTGRPDEYQAGRKDSVCSYIYSLLNVRNNGAFIEIINVKDIDVSMRKPWAMGKSNLWEVLPRLHAVNDRDCLLKKWQTSSVRLA